MVQLPGSSRASCAATGTASVAPITNAAQRAIARVDEDGEIELKQGSATCRRVPTGTWNRCAKRADPVDNGDHSSLDRTQRKRRTRRKTHAFSGLWSLSCRPTQ